MMETQAPVIHKSTITPTDVLIAMSKGWDTPRLIEVTRLKNGAYVNAEAVYFPHSEGGNPYRQVSSGFECNVFVFAIVTLNIAKKCGDTLISQCKKAYAGYVRSKHTRHDHKF